jgi:acetate kinase
VDALAFTGGVGENSEPIRERAAQGLAFLGVGMDAQKNGGAGDGQPVVDREISAAGTRVRTFVVAAREDLQMAAEVRAVLSVDAS